MNLHPNGVNRMNSNGKRRKRHKSNHERQKEVILKFHYQCNNNGERRLCSYFSGQSVYLHRHLYEMMYSSALRGQLQMDQIDKISIKVYLRKGWDRQNNQRCFIADNSRLLFALPELPFEKCRKPKIIIDGANLFITLERMRQKGFQLTAAESIKRVLKRLDSASAIQLILCQGDEEVFSEELHLIRESFNGKLSVLAADIVRQNINGRKSQIRHDDKLAISRIWETVENDAETQLLVVFSGDKHFVRPLRRWLASTSCKDGRAARPRQLVVVSSRLKNNESNGFVSSELLELTNHQNAVFLQLERLG